ncbi:hypothetical protein CXF34_08005, partial [Corynebacterium bovis]|uniref:AMP-binding protein n=1 Tax=Corynebacterium bovis TaxID=36808 RepID=UPI000FC106BA
MRAGEAPRLVVCDVDGTFVTSRDRVSPRTPGVVASLTAAGAGFMLATGRPPRWLLPVLDQVRVRPVCVCANGAVVYDAAADTVVHAETLAPDLLAAVAPEIARATAAVGGATFAVERVGRSAFDRADELFAVEPEYPHAWDTDEHSVQPRAELLAQPAVKLLVRNPALDSPELYALVREAVDPAVWSRLAAAARPEAYNFYGPTETTVDAVSARLRDHPAPVIGHPLPGTDVMVLDRWLRPVPDGLPGELYITGSQVTQGYTGREDAARLTAAAFVAAPGGARAYRTGDIVVRRAGALAYLGRADDQVKVRGFRVEPAEVLAAVRSLEGVDDARVGVHRGPGGPRLVAAVVPRSAADREDPA